MAIKNDYAPGQQLAAEDWNEVATLVPKMRIIKPPVATYDEALALAVGDQPLEIRVVDDGTPSNNGMYHYNGATGMLQPVRILTPEMESFILNLMQVDNPQNG